MKKTITLRKQRQEVESTRGKREKGEEEEHGLGPRALEALIPSKQQEHVERGGILVPPEDHVEHPVVEHDTEEEKVEHHSHPGRQHTAEHQGRASSSRKAVRIAKESAEEDDLNFRILFG